MKKAVGLTPETDNPDEYHPSTSKIFVYLSNYVLENNVNSMRGNPKGQVLKTGIQIL